MALKKIKLGELIEPCDERNSDNKYTLQNVKGISIQKIFIETKADMQGVSLKSYKIVKPDQFAYVTVTSRNGEKITLAYNDTKDTYIVSSSYVVFKIKRKDLINSHYLFMYFNRPEFDRYSRYNSWGSARETFSWDDMCDIELELPDLPTQEKFVKTYLAMLENQKSYERGLDDLKLVCEGYIENIRKNYKQESIIDYIEERTEKNKDGEISFMKGVGLNGFIEPNQVRTKNSLKKCNIFYKGDFVYPPSSLKNGVISYNKDYDKAICTEEYIVFHIKDDKKLNPYYLLMWLKREQLGRYIDFASCDSVRNRFYFKDLNIIEIPIPEIDIQNAVAKVYEYYMERKEINEMLKKQIKDICPILIEGSIEESKEN